MSETKIGVYAGTFDPITLGHVWMIEQGAQVFDQLIVAIGDNPGKKCMFSLAERLEMIRELVDNFDNVRVDSYYNLYLIDYARQVKAKFILRGIRSVADYEYERNMRNINADLAPEVTTYFLMPPHEVADISSSMVKGLVGPEGWEKVVRRFVSELVFSRLESAYREMQKAKASS